MANTTFSIEPTDDERRAIYMDAIRRNALRKSAQLPLIDVATTSRQEIALIRMRKFRHIIQPYIRQALAELPSPRGLANRFSTMYQAKMMANERLMKDYGRGFDEFPRNAPEGRIFNQNHNGMVDPPPSTQ